MVDWLKRIFGLDALEEVRTLQTKVRTLEKLAGPDRALTELTEGKGE